MKSHRKIFYIPLNNPVSATKAAAVAGIDPFAYLRDILPRLPTMTNRQIPEVTPEARAKAS